MGHFCLFLFISLDKNSTNLNINNKSVDGVLGTQTWGSRMVGARESIELWWPPTHFISYQDKKVDVQILCIVQNAVVGMIKDVIGMSQHFLIGLIC